MPAMSKPLDRPAAVIFDMDGLMFDTERIYRDTWNRSAAETGFPIEGDLWGKLVGRNNRDCEATLIRAFGSGFDVGRFRERWKELWLGHVREHGVPVKPGLFELLDTLERRGIPRAVATSTDLELAEPTLHWGGVDGRFGRVVTGDEIERGKPAPDIFLAAASGLRVPPGDCVVLEDSNAGVAAGSAAGMRTLMVPDTEEPSAATRELAWGIVPSLLAVRDLLTSEER
jgi:HAD superfamily hydrolase (TIGR01509 family)